MQRFKKTMQYIDNQLFINYYKNINVTFCLL